MRVFLLMFTLWACLAAPSPGRMLESPSNLTLTAQPDGSWVLTWDPILDDQLMGYNVFSRRGTAEFTRITKIPLGSAMFKFKGVDVTRPLEMVVAAEYEDGRSPASRPAFSNLARQARAAFAFPKTETAPSEAGNPGVVSATAGESAAGRAAKPELGLQPTPSPTPFADAPLRDRQSLLAPYRMWRTSVAMEGQMMNIISKGNDYMWNMPWVPEDWNTYDLNVRHNWEFYYMRLMLRAPVTVRYGIFPGLEAGVTVPYQYEFAKSVKGVIDGKDYTDTTHAEIAELNTSGLGDIEGGVRLAILKDPSLILGLKLSLPTGVSRFKSMLDFLYFDKLAAGNGNGVTQATVSFLYGLKGIKKGLHLEGAYTPGTAETVLIDSGGATVKHQAVHGDVAEIGGGFTLPWSESRSSVVLGLLVRDIKESKWIYADNNLGVMLDRQVTQPYYRMLSGLNFYEDTQLEAYIEVNQDVRLMTLTGKLQFINRADGYTLGISGGFIF